MMKPKENQQNENKSKNGTQEEEEEAEPFKIEETMSLEEYERLEKE